MTEEICDLAKRLVSFYDWDNNYKIRSIYKDIKPNELKLAEAYLEKEKGKYCKRKEDVEEKFDFWYQYIDIYDNIIEEEGSLTIVDDFFKRCFTIKQAILFDGMTVVAIYQIDDVTGHFYLKTYNTDSRFHNIITKFKKGFERINSNINLDNLDNL